MPVPSAARSENVDEPGGTSPHCDVRLIQCRGWPSSVIERLRESTTAVAPAGIVPVICTRLPPTINAGDVNGPTSIACQCAGAVPELLTVASPVVLSATVIPPAATVMPPTSTVIPPPTAGVAAVTEPTIVEYHSGSSASNETRA